MGKRWIRQHGMALDIPEQKVLYRHRYCNHVYALSKNCEWDLPQDFDLTRPQSEFEPEPEHHTRPNEESQVRSEVSSGPKWQPREPIQILSHTHERDIHNTLQIMDRELKQVLPTTSRPATPCRTSQSSPL